MLALLALPPHSKKVMGSIPAWGAVGSGGQVLPRPSVLRWAISWAFLCGVCMFSPCSQGGSSTKNPNRKTCKRTEPLSCPSLTKTDGSLGPRALTSCPLLLGGPGGRTVQDGKRQRINSPRPQACVCVCVCPVSPPYITCVLQCVACANKV